MNCNVTYTEVKGNSLVTTKNFLKAVKAIDSFNNIIDYTKFSNEVGTINRDGRERYGLKDNLIKSEDVTGQRGKKAFFNTSLFQEVDRQKGGVKYQLNNVNYVFKIIDKLSNNPKVSQWFKQLGDTDKFWSKVQQDLQIPKEQVTLLKQSEGNDINEKLTSFAANYSYTVEINTAKETKTTRKNNAEFTQDEYEAMQYLDDKDLLGIEDDRLETNKQNTQHYSNLTVPGFKAGTYKELRFTTPLITPSIKGHAQFAEANDIGWSRVADTDPKTKYTDKDGNIFTIENGLIVFEKQSDLFQKGRDKEQLVNYQSINDNYSNTGKFIYNGDEYQIQGDEEYGYEFTKNELTISEKEAIDALNKSKVVTKDSKGNNFLQLLNKDNNWVTFFVKSIVQSTAKQTVTEVQQEDVEAKVRELEKSGLLKIKCD